MLDKIKNNYYNKKEQDKNKVKSVRQILGELYK